MKKNRTLVVAIAVLAVAGVAGYAIVTGMYPPKSGTEGAIGAATRYQSTQISEADVALTDAAVQAFLQSDTFHKIATNPVFRKEVMNNAKSVQQLKNLYEKSKLSSGADLAELLDGAEVAELMNDSELLNAAAGDELFKKAVNQEAVVEMAKNIITANKKSKAQAEATAAELAKASEVLKAAGVTSELESKSKLLYNEGFAELLAKGHAAELLDNADVLELLSDDGLAEMFNDGDLQAELMSKNVVEAMKNAPVEALRSGVIQLQKSKGY